VKPNKQKNPNLSVKKRNEKLRASFFSLHPERLKNRAAILSFLSHHHLLLGAAGLDVVALRVPLVPQELGVHPLARLVLVLLGLLDAVAVGLVGLVVGRMVLGLGHGVKLTRVCVKWRAVVVLEKREGEKKKKKRSRSRLKKKVSEKVSLFEGRRRIATRATPQSKPSFAAAPGAKGRAQSSFLSLKQPSAASSMQRRGRIDQPSSAWTSERAIKQSRRQRERERASGGGGDRRRRAMMMKRGRRRGGELSHSAHLLLLLYTPGAEKDARNPERCDGASRREHREGS